VTIRSVFAVIPAFIFFFALKTMAVPAIPWDLLNPMGGPVSRANQVIVHDFLGRNFKTLFAASVRYKPEYYASVIKAEAKKISDNIAGETVFLGQRDVVALISGLQDGTAESLDALATWMDMHPWTAFLESSRTPVGNLIALFLAPGDEIKNQLAREILVNLVPTEPWIMTRVMLSELLARAASRKLLVAADDSQEFFDALVKETLDPENQLSVLKAIKENGDVDRSADWVLMKALDRAAASPVATLPGKATYRLQAWSLLCSNDLARL
jgi:hypothetical protein